MFQLVFRGECVPGVDEQSARKNARALFKASEEQVNRMFSGQSVVLRNRLEQAQAEKYRQILRRHGLVAYVQPMPASRDVSSGTAASSVPPAATAAAAPATQQDTGSRQPQQAERPPATEPGERLPVAGEKVDAILAGSDLRLDPPGVTLIEPREVEPPMFEHLDDWTLAPPGTDLGVDRQQPPPIVPDVSHLSLTDDESAS